MITKITVLDSAQNPVEIEVANCYLFGVPIYFTEIHGVASTNSYRFHIFFQNKSDISCENLIKFFRENSISYSYNAFSLGHYSAIIEGYQLADILRYEKVERERKPTKDFDRYASLEL